MESIYWQYFRGMQGIQWKCPVDPTTLLRWRRRLADKRLGELLASTIQVGLATKARRPEDTAIQKRPSPIRHDRQRHLKHHRLANKASKPPRTRPGAVMRDLERRVHGQVKQKNATRRVFSLHEPEVDCIGKGKAHQFPRILPCQRIGGGRLAQFLPGQHRIEALTVEVVREHPDPERGEGSCHTFEEGAAEAALSEVGEDRDGFHPVLPRDGHPFRVDCHLPSATASSTPNAARAAAKPRCIQVRTRGEPATRSRKRWARKA